MPTYQARAPPWGSKRRNFSLMGGSYPATHINRLRPSRNFENQWRKYYA
ncbi:hypothetical protein FACS18949_14200 [Clostridia bacterium]|nr:hypothetical protein FACS189425_03160 [Clostridia bacterium]GHV35711.1 hypothetical protein FACS18949_14200 [Clostridia bacterium]